MSVFGLIFAYALGQSSGEARARAGAERAERERRFQEALSREPAKDKIAHRAVAEALVGTALSDHGKDVLRAALETAPEQAAADALIVAEALARQKETLVPSAKGELAPGEWLIAASIMMPGLYFVANAHEFVPIGPATNAIGWHGQAGAVADAFSTVAWWMMLLTGIIGVAGFIWLAARKWGRKGKIA